MSHSTETLPTRSAHQEKHASSLAKDTKGDNDASNSDGGDTDPREDLATDSKPVKSNLPAEASAVPKSKTKLGRIGGRPKSDSNKESDATPRRDTATPFSKLGAQAEVHGYESTKPQRDSVRFGRAGNQPQTPSQPRESSQDRANRKREQLKRELESKRQTGAKKKRKF